MFRNWRRLVENYSSYDILTWTEQYYFLIVYAKLKHSCFKATFVRAKIIATIVFRGAILLGRVGRGKFKTAPDDHVSGF